MENIITKELFITSPENTFLEGYIYLKDFQQLITKKGDPYISGELYSKISIPFKMFGDVSYIDDSYKDCIIEAKLEVSKFAGKRQALLHNIKKCTNDEIKKEYFVFYKKYDEEEYVTNFLELLKRKLSYKGYELLLDIFEVDYSQSLFQSFITNYAASTNHDNCKGGLLAHSYKCLLILDFLESNIYEWISKINTNELSNQDIIDLLYLGTALHDIGKVYEIDNTMYRINSFNTHRQLGAEIIYEHKNKIISKYNEHFYHLLISILVGHHDIYGESSKTLYAFLVHKIDDIEACFTNIEQRLEISIFKKDNGEYLEYNDNRLFYL